MKDELNLEIKFVTINIASESLHYIVNDHRYKHKRKSKLLELLNTINNLNQEAYEIWKGDER